jgi:predicted Zn-dependent peptidase
LNDYGKLFDEGNKFQAVTADDVMRVAKKYFQENNRNLVVLVPEAPGGQSATQ